MSTSVVYSHETVSLDGQFFSDCEFLKSRLIFAGGEPPPSFVQTNMARVKSSRARASRSSFSRVTTTSYFPSRTGMRSLVSCQQRS